MKSLCLSFLASVLLILASGATAQAAPVGKPAFSAVPEPGTALFGLGLIGVALLRRRR